MCDNYKIQYLKKHPSSHAKHQQRHRIYHDFALASVEKHAPEHRAHVFSSSRNIRKWLEIHVSRPLFEGNEWNVGLF